MKSRKTWVSAAVAAAVVIVGLLTGHQLTSGGHQPGPQLSQHQNSSSQHQSAQKPGSQSSGQRQAAQAKGGTVAESALPQQAKDTLALIRRGGPYPYDRDGVVFSNFEGVLPKQSRGFYHEYTVITPGERDRGARRIVVGQDGSKYYSDDHYASFRRIVEGS